MHSATAGNVCRHCNLKLNNGSITSFSFVLNEQAFLPGGTGGAAVHLGPQKGGCPGLHHLDGEFYSSKFT